MKAKTVKEVIIAAKWILENVGWHKGNMFRDVKGKAIISSTAVLNPERVGSVCAAGAVRLVDKFPSLEENTLRALSAQMGRPVWLWNDTIASSKKEVLDLFDQAIAAQKE